MRRRLSFLKYFTLSVGVCFAVEAAEQSWTKYVSRELQFTMNFPGTPFIECTTYTSAQGHALPAQTFLAQDGTGLYKLTVVDFSGHSALESGAATHAAEALMHRGRGHHNSYAYMDGLSGHDLSLIEPNGRRLQATIYFFDQRLYIAEGSDLEDAPLPSRFTYSLIITHADGTQLNLDGYNRESFNAFESPF